MSASHVSRRSVLAGAFGREAFTTRGEQFGRYEAAIGTGQSNFWFAVNG